MRRAWRLGLLLAVGPALLAPAALAQAPKREGAEIGDKQRDLHQAQKRLLEERQKAAEARKREAGVLSELEAIDQRLMDKRRQVAALDGRLRRAQADIGELQGEIGRLQSENAALKQALLDRGLPLPGGVTPGAPSARAPQDEKPSGEAEVDRVMSLVERVWRRLIEMMANLQRDLNKT